MPAIHAGPAVPAHKLTPQESVEGSWFAKTLIFDRRWATPSSHPASAWSTIADSTVIAETIGRPLQITMDLSCWGGSHVTCRPIVDGIWAGDYSSQPKPPGDSFWTEGLMFSGNGVGWRKWSTTRIDATGYMFSS
ncbi:MAG: hypothetical protein IV094_14705 [Vitreoscilla sp.]|nr:hypothetical protein [Vitreoscilla sp.]